MAKKKVSDTIAQQRKAREDFLELKKMQSGEVDANADTPEKIVPVTFEEKRKNFWYHYKWHTIVSVFAIITLTVLIVQTINRVNYDMQVVYFTYTPVLDNQTAEIGDYLEKLSKDINGDGEVNIQVVNCSVSPEETANQYNNTMFTKVQSLIAAEPKAQLFITDEKSEEYFTGNLEGFFSTEQLDFPKSFYEDTKTEEFSSLPEGLQIACRTVTDTTIEKNKDVGKIHKEALHILSELEKKD